MSALLFKLEAYTELQLNEVADTSKLCQWNRWRKSAEPGILKSINFKQPKIEDLPQRNTKIIQTGNYCTKNFEPGIATLSREKILDLEK